MVLGEDEEEQLEEEEEEEEGLEVLLEGLKPLSLPATQHILGTINYEIERTEAIDAFETTQPALRVV